MTTECKLDWQLVGMCRLQLQARSTANMLSSSSWTRERWLARLVLGMAAMRVAVSLDGLDCKSSPCMYGICVDEAHNRSYRCYCIDGYTGINCEINWDECWSSPCLNGGTCQDGIAAYNCSCPEGFVGPRCEQRQSRCASQPCLNGATCLEPATTGGERGATCLCREGFSGEWCELDASVCTSSVCRNGGECLEGPGLSFECRCPVGWQGRVCEQDVDECALQPCRNAGLCINLPGSYQCACLFGFSGRDCERPVQACQKSPCLNNAVCLLEDAQPVCYCVPDYHGLLCELRYDDCQSKAARCHNGGSCLDGVNSFSCACPPAFAGETCLDYAPTTSSAEPSSSSHVDDDVLVEGRTDSELDTSTLASTDSFTSSPTSSQSEPEATTTATTATTTGEPEDTGSTVGVVTMFPSSLPADDSSPTSLAVSEATFPSEPTDPTYPSEATDETFTSVSEFHRSTFGSDIDEDSSSSSSSSSSTLGTAASATAEPPRTPPVSLDSAAFNGHSYVRQKFSIDSGSLSIVLRLRTKANSGIIVHALFDDERYLLLYMETAQLKFQFSCGLQTMLFGELDSPINNGYEVELETRFDYVAEQEAERCSARLLVNGSLAMSGEQLLQTREGAPRQARLHLGGIPLAFSPPQQQQQQPAHAALGFVGCMSQLKVNQVPRDFVRDSVEAVQIEECRSFLCLSKPCKNFGACEERDGVTSCSCVPGFSGQFCERSVCDEQPCQLGATCLVSPGASFLCVCPLGAHGLLCDKDASLLQPSFSVLAPGFSSYMAYGLGSSVRDGMELSMRILPHNLEQISLIAYMGQSGPRRDSSDHLALTYVRGYLMLTWDLGSGVRRIFTSSPIDARARKPHRLRVGRSGPHSWLYVDGLGNVSARAAGANTRLDVSPILYIGGHKSPYFDALPHDLPLHSGFSGCIYDVELRTDDSLAPPLTMASPATGRGVGDCHRNECSQHSCKNGAVCLNYGPTYSCICMKDWQGPDCSSPANCTSSNSCY